jgi:hypothetical protein
VARAGCAYLWAIHAPRPAGSRRPGTRHRRRWTGYDLGQVPASVRSGLSRRPNRARTSPSRVARTAVASSPSCRASTVSAVVRTAAAPGCRTQRGRRTQASAWRDATRHTPSSRAPRRRTSPRVNADVSEPRVEPLETLSAPFAVAALHVPDAGEQVDDRGTARAVRVDHPLRDVGGSWTVLYGLGGVAERCDGTEACQRIGRPSRRNRVG